MITTSRRKVERDLANVLKAIAFWDIHIENYKIGMAENHSFNVNVCFSVIDTGNRGYITKKQIHSFLSAGQVNCSHKECQQMIEQCFQMEEIDFGTFKEFLLPKTNEQLKQYHMNGSTEANLIMMQFNREALLRLFERILISIRELSQLRSLLHEQQDILEIWKIVSVKSPSQTGNLSEKAIKDFIEAQGGHFNTQEFKALLRSLLTNTNQDYITQGEFNQLIMPPIVVVSNAFNDEIQERIRLKYQELGIKQPDFKVNPQITAQQNGMYNFRKVFDPVREGRPQFKFDAKYMDELKDYKNKYLAPSRNYELQYKNPPLQIKNHDFFFQDYYLNLHSQDQEELYFNRFGKRYVYQ